MRIKIDQDTEVEIIKKGEKSGIPLGFLNWANGLAQENGVNVIWGGRGEMGTFISEKLLKRFLEEIEKNDKTDDNDS